MWVIQMSVRYTYYNAGFYIRGHLVSYEGPSGIVLELFRVIQIPMSGDLGQVSTVHGAAKRNISERTQVCCRYFDLVINASMANGRTQEG